MTRPSIRAARRALLLVALLALLPAVRALRVRAMDHFLATQTYEDVYYVPPAGWLRVLSLGHDEALASLLWTRALVYFGDELAHRGEVQHVYDYAEAILKLDPHFKAVYTWAATAGLYRTGKVTVDDMWEAVRFLERGVHRFPDDGELAWELGATLAYELAPHLEDKDEARRVRERAMEHFLVAARRGAGPPWIALTNFTQLRKLGQLEQAARHLEEMYAMVESPKTKAEIARRLATIRSRTYAEAFRRAHDELRREHAETYPWMSETLYLLVRPVPVVDEGTLLRHRFAPAEAWSGEEAPDAGPSAAPAD